MGSSRGDEEGGQGGNSTHTLCTMLSHLLPLSVSRIRGQDTARLCCVALWLLTPFSLRLSRLPLSPKTLVLPKPPACKWRPRHLRSFRGAAVRHAPSPPLRRDSYALPRGSFLNFFQEHPKPTRGRCGKTVMSVSLALSPLPRLS